MRTLRGVYKDGEIKLLEDILVNGTKKVLVTFLEDEEEMEEATIRNITLEQSTQSFKNYLNDQREDLYQDFLK